MATDLATENNDAIGEINKYKLSHRIYRRFQGSKGSRSRHRSADFGDEGRARVDARLPSSFSGHLQFQADAKLGRKY